MSRFLLVLAMLTSLVVCPFDCMGRAADGSDAPTPGGKCACCSHCRTDSEKPADPTPEERQCDCICCGAVVADVTAAIPDASVSWGVFVVDETISAEMILSACRLNRDALMGQMQAGRSCHLVLHSWLV